MASARDAEHSSRMRQLEADALMNPDNMSLWLELAWFAHLRRTPTCVDIPVAADTLFRAELARAATCADCGVSIRDDTLHVPACRQLCVFCEQIEVIANDRDYEFNMTSRDNGFQTSFDTYICRRPAGGAAAAGQTRAERNIVR